MHTALVRRGALLACLLGPSTAAGQRPVPVVVGVARAARPWTAAERPVGIAMAAPSSRGRQVAMAAAVGAGVGAAVGAILAIERVSRPEVTDHSEDGIVYVVYVGGGALVGLVTGVVVGLARST